MRYTRFKVFVKNNVDAKYFYYSSTKRTSATNPNRREKRIRVARSDWRRFLHMTKRTILPPESPMLLWWAWVQTHFPNVPFSGQHFWESSYYIVLSNYQRIVQAPSYTDRAVHSIPRAMRFVRFCVYAQHRRTTACQTFSACRARVLVCGCFDVAALSLVPSLSIIAGIHFAMLDANP